MTRISALSPNEVTRELVALIARAGPDERRIAWTIATELETKAVSRDQLTDKVASLTREHQAIMLFVLRRLCGVGLDTYGQLSLATSRKDWLAEAVDEDADGMVYRAALRLTGGETPLHRAATSVAWQSIAEAIRRGSV